MRHTRTGATLHTAEITERLIEQSSDQNHGGEIELTVWEWDPNEGSADAEGNDLPLSEVLARFVEAKRQGVTVRLGEVADHLGDMSELQVGIYTGGRRGGAALEGFLPRSQIDSLIDLLQAAKMKAEAVFIPRSA